MFSKKPLVSLLKEAGVEIAPGLSQTQLQAVEGALKAPLPPEYRKLLSEGVPVAYKGNTRAFPNWSEPEEAVKLSQDLVEFAFTYDIEHAGYWHPAFGTKPDDIDSAKSQALSLIKQWPPLVRIFAHRFMPTSPQSPGNPVFSFRQVSDVVYYGHDFEDYLEREFHINVPGKRKAEYTFAPPWSDILFGKR